MTESPNLAIATQMIAHYNAQDADAYVALKTESACEASYRGTVVREGREGNRAGLKAMFGEFPENRAEIIKGYALGEAPRISVAALCGRAEILDKACGTELHLCASAPLREPKWLPAQDFAHG